MECASGFRFLCVLTPSFFSYFSPLVVGFYQQTEALGADCVVFPLGSQGRRKEVCQKSGFSPCLSLSLSFTHTLSLFLSLFLRSPMFSLRRLFSTSPQPLSSVIRDAEETVSRADKARVKFDTQKKWLTSLHATSAKNPSKYLSVLSTCNELEQVCQMCAKQRRGRKSRSPDCCSLRSHLSLNPRTFTKSERVR